MKTSEESAKVVVNKSGLQVTILYNRIFLRRRRGGTNKLKRLYVPSFYRLVLYLWLSKEGFSQNFL